MVGGEGVDWGQRTRELNMGLGQVVWAWGLMDWTDLWVIGWVVLLAYLVENHKDQICKVLKVKGLKMENSQSSHKGPFMHSFNKPRTKNVIFQNKTPGDQICHFCKVRGLNMKFPQSFHPRVKNDFL